MNFANNLFIHSQKTFLAIIAVGFYGLYLEFFAEFTLTNVIIIPILVLGLVAFLNTYWNSLKPRN